MAKNMAVKVFLIDSMPCQISVSWKTELQIMVYLEQKACLVIQMDIKREAKTILWWCPD